MFEDLEPSVELHNSFTISWELPNVGFGQYSFDSDEIGNLYIDNEFMSKEAIKRVLNLMIDQATLIDLRDVPKEDILSSRKFTKQWINSFHVELKNSSFNNKPTEKLKRHINELCFGYADCSQFSYYSDKQDMINYTVNQLSSIWEYYSWRQDTSETFKYLLTRIHSLFCVYRLIKRKEQQCQKNK